MGTDIHAVFQKRTPTGWEDVTSTWDQDRHYFLFAWLADVRNGFGFAGVRTHEPIKPILAERRGLPGDFEVMDEDHPMNRASLTSREVKWMDEFPDDCRTSDDRYKFSMGDHSYNWLTADEILNAERPANIIRHGGGPRASTRHRLPSSHPVPIRPWLGCPQ